MPRLYDLSCTLSTKDFTSMKSLIINGLIHQNSSFKMGIVRFGSFSVTNFPFLKIRKLWGTLGVGSPWKKIQFSKAVHIPCPPCLPHISFLKWNLPIATEKSFIVWKLIASCFTIFVQNFQSFIFNFCLFCLTLVSLLHMHAHNKSVKSKLVFEQRRWWWSLHETYPKKQFLFKTFPQSHIQLRT